MSNYIDWSKVPGNIDGCVLDVSIGVPRLLAYTVGSSKQVPTRTDKDWMLADIGGAKWYFNTDLTPAIIDTIPNWEDSLCARNGGDGINGVL